jgi:hypothetical protein
MGAIPKVYADWFLLNLYTALGEDLSDRWLSQSGIVCERGKDQIRLLSPAQAGKLDFSIDNRDHLFSVENTAGPLYGKLEPGRTVKLRMDFNSTIYDLATCVLDDIPQRPQWSDLSVGLPSLGFLSKLRGKNVTTALYQNITTDVAINHLLNAAGWPLGGRVIQPGKTTLLWWWLDNQDAFEALMELLATEGPGAAIYEDVLGRIVFENRHARFTQARSTVSQFTFRDDDYLFDFQPDPKLKDVINTCSLTVKERAIQDEATVWQMTDPLVLAPGETRKIQARASSGDPFQNAQVPSPTSGVNAVQTITVSGSPSAGSISVGFQGAKIPTQSKSGGTSLVLGSTATQIKTALETLQTIKIGNVNVTGGPLGTNPVVVTFINDLGNQPLELMSVTSNFSGGTNPGANIEQTTAGRKPDFILAAGGLDSISLDQTSGPSVTIIAVAGPNGATPSSLSLRAQVVSVVATLQVETTIDTSLSQSKYGLRPLGGTPMPRAEIDPAFAQDYANAVPALYQMPRTVATVLTRDVDDIVLMQQLTLEISSRISVVETESGFNGDLFIEHILHRVDDAANLFTEFGCEKAFAANYAVVDSAIVDSSLVAF